MTVLEFCIHRLERDIEWREKGLKAEVESLAGTPDTVLTMADNIVRQKMQLELLRGLE